MESQKYYDIAIQGAWYTSKYGDILTYFALNQFLTKELKLKVLMIDKTKMQNMLIWSDYDYVNPLVRDFTNKYYDISRVYDSSSDVRELNDYCETFIVASDQCWNHFLYRQTGYMMYLDFVNLKKNKIAYSASFAHERFLGTESEKMIAKYFLKQFNKISVRELKGIEICKDIFDIDACCLIDPLFLCGKNCFDKIVDESDIIVKNKLVSYILDPNIDKVKIINKIAQENNLEKINIIDANYNDIEKNKKTFFDLNEVVTDIKSVADFINYIKNANFVITDSYHGSCLCLLLNRPFICLFNKDRGVERFNTLIEKFPIKNVVIKSFDEFHYNQSDFNIDYNVVNDIINTEVKIAKSWLIDAIKLSQSSPEIDNETINNAIMAMSTEINKRDYYYRSEKLGLYNLIMSNKNIYEEKTANINNLINDLSRKCSINFENISKLNEKYLILLNKNKIIKNYYRYKFLSKFLIGKKRKHYKEKAKLYHEKIRLIRNLESEIKI